MLRKLSAIGFAVLLVVGAAFFAWQIPIKMKYDKLRDHRLGAPVFSSYPMDAEAREFLESVRKSWEIRTQERGDAVFAQVSSMTGLEESVEGVVTLYTHEIPEYSFVDRRRNAEEAVMAATLSVTLPMSVDNRIYVEEGLAFVRLNARGVEVYEDTEDGLTRTLYIKPTPGNKARVDKRDDA